MSATLTPPMAKLSSKTMKEATVLFEGVKNLSEGVDPNNAKRKLISFIVRLDRLPFDLPNDANPRQPWDAFAKMRAKKYPDTLTTYEEVQLNALNRQPGVPPGHFVHMSKGLTIMANAIAVEGDDVCISCVGRGSLDGGHLMHLMKDLNEKGAFLEPSFAKMPNWVKVHVSVGINDRILEAAVAKAHNTGLKLKQTSLIERKGGYDILKSEMEGLPYFDRIGWKESDAFEIKERIKGEWGKAGSLKNAPTPRVIEAPYIIQCMYAMDVKRFPINGDDANRKAVGKVIDKDEVVLKAWDSDPHSFMHLFGILPEILHLHDELQFNWIKHTGRIRHAPKPFCPWTDLTKKKTAQPLCNDEFGIIKPTNVQSTGLTFPMLSALRVMIELDPKGNAQWRGGFDAAQEIMHNMLRPMVLWLWDNGIAPNNASRLVGVYDALFLMTKNYCVDAKLI